MTAYFDLAFTPAVCALQERKGSRVHYAIHTEAGPDEEHAHDLDERERELICSRDSFYLASVSETGWPYVQHRGGPPGFVRLLDAHTIGWLERTGNRQYVGTGNISADGRVAAIFMDYPTRARLKLFGRASYHANPAAELLEALSPDGARTDGAVTIEVLATDWNCQKYITPRFTADQVAAEVAALERRIHDLERQLPEGS